jgi:hypothetical protein
MTTFMLKAQGDTIHRNASNTHTATRPSNADEPNRCENCSHISETQLNVFVEWLAFHRTGGAMSRPWARLLLTKGFSLFCSVPSRGILK